MTTLLVSGGQLVDELSVRRADLLIEEGRVVAVLRPDHARTADDTLDAFSLVEAMQACAGLGLLLALHAEDPVETRRLGAGARAAGRNQALDWARSRPPESECHAVQSALAAGRATGARLHFVHISTADSARLLGE